MEFGMFVWRVYYFRDGCFKNLFQTCFTYNNLLILKKITQWMTWVCDICFSLSYLSSHYFTIWAILGYNVLNIRKIQTSVAASLVTIYSLPQQMFVHHKSGVFKLLILLKYQVIIGLQQINPLLGNDPNKILICQLLSRSVSNFIYHLVTRPHQL